MLRIKGNSHSSPTNIRSARANCWVLFVTSMLLTDITISQAEEFRTWTDITGQYQRGGKFQRRDGDSITLLLKNGKSCTIPFDKLSQQDQRFVDSLFEDKPQNGMKFKQLLASATIPKHESELTPEEEEICERIGKKIEADISRGEDAVSEWIDTKDMATRSIDGLGVPANVIEAVIANNINNIKAALSGKTFSEKGRPKYRRARKRNGSIQLEFRALDAVGTPGYYSLMLSPRLGDKLPVKDVFIYSAGETITQTVRRGMVLTAAAADPEFAKSLKGEDSELFRSTQSLDQFNKLMNENKKPEALEVLKGLPRIKTLFFMRIAVASEIGVTEYIQACKDYKQAFPNDTTLCFISLSSSLVGRNSQEVAGNSQEALLAAEEVEKEIGPDPYLDFIRGNLADMAGDSDQAMSLWIRAVAAEPGLMLAYEKLRLKYLKREDYEHVAEVIEFVEKQFNTDLWETISNDDASKDFLLSSPGKRWQKSKTLSTTK